MIIFFQPKTFLEEIYINCKKKFVSEMSIIIFIVCKGAEPRFQARHVNGRGGDFFWNSSTENKKGGDSIFCSSSVGGTCQGWSIFPWPFQTLTLQNINSLTAAATISYSYMSWLIIIWSTFFISFLLLFSSTTSSGFCPIFTINNMEKCEHAFENESIPLGRVA